MAQSRFAVFLALVPVLSVALNSSREAYAVPTVWSGPSITFTKTGAIRSDTTDPLNQDRLTDNVWLTRGGDQGMFNIAPGRESSYIRYTSPADTQWATSVMVANSGKTISAANWAELAFTDWAPSYGGPGSALGGNITTHNAVVHLLTDDIYLDLTFTNFVSGGEFTYTRSTAAVAAPTSDYNHNGVVDAADYVIWRQTLGDSVTPNGSGADGNSNGSIEQGDYTYWRERFGNAPAGLGSVFTSVPEPVTAAVALQLVAGFLCTFRRRRTAVVETNFQYQSRSNNLAVPEPASGLRTVRSKSLIGVRLWVSRQGRLSATNSARKVENDCHASLENFVPSHGLGCVPVAGCCKARGSRFTPLAREGGVYKRSRIGPVH